MSSTEQYQAPPNGFRTFVIVWMTQSISVFGSALTWFAVTVWLTQSSIRNLSKSLSLPLPSPPSASPTPSPSSLRL